MFEVGKINKRAVKKEFQILKRIGWKLLYRGQTGNWRQLFKGLKVQANEKQLSPQEKSYFFYIFLIYHLSTSTLLPLSSGAALSSIAVSGTDDTGFAIVAGFSSASSSPAKFSATALLAAGSGCSPS